MDKLPPLFIMKFPGSTLSKFQKGSINTKSVQTCSNNICFGEGDKLNFWRFVRFIHHDTPFRINQVLLKRNVLLQGSMN